MAWSRQSVTFTLLNKCLVTIMNCRVDIATKNNISNIAVGTNLNVVNLPSINGVGIYCRHFPDHIFKCISLMTVHCISIQTTQYNVPYNPINNKPALTNIMSWRLKRSSKRWPVHRCHMVHYDDVIMGSIASPITSLTIFTQAFIQTQIKENIKALRHWPLCDEFTGTGEFPAQMASNAENVSIWWRHHALGIVWRPDLWSAPDLPHFNALVTRNSRK